MFKDVVTEYYYIYSITAVYIKLVIKVCLTLFAYCICTVYSHEAILFTKNELNYCPTLNIKLDINKRMEIKSMSICTVYLPIFMIIIYHFIHINDISVIILLCFCSLCNYHQYTCLQFFCNACYLKCNTFQWMSIFVIVYSVSIVFFPTYFT